jgi:hypothetical protein
VKPRQHGTDATYRWHYRNDGTPCLRCYDAHLRTVNLWQKANRPKINAYQRLWRARRKAQVQP